MQLVLVMFRAEGERRSFSLTKEVTTIGRREDCDLRIPVSEVSRKHCRVIKDGEDVRIEDLGSSNGTFHNGQRIQGSVTVQPGDSVQVGPVVFVVQVDGVPADEELAPFTDREAHALEDSAAVDVIEHAEPDANTAAENMDDMLLASGGESEEPSLHAEPEELQMSDDHEPVPTMAGRKSLDISDEPLSMADDSHASGSGVAPALSGEEEHAPGHEPIPLDLDSDDEHHTPLSEDELLLDLKDDHHEHHA